MKNLFILLLIIATHLLPAQVIVASECAPQTYNSVNYPQNYTPSGCNFKGAYKVVPTEGKVYETLQVFAGKTYHQNLPLGFGTSYQQGLWKVYMNPYLYRSIGKEEAIQRAEAEGFCNPKLITIQAANEFPGFEFN